MTHLAYSSGKRKRSGGAAAAEPDRPGAGEPEQPPK